MAEQKNAKVLVVYYSMYGHVHRLAQAVVEGALQVPGIQSEMKRVPETLSPEVLEKMHATETQKTMSSIPLCSVADLAAADAIIFGTPTRFGNMCGQMRQFLDMTGKLWQTNALVGKIGGVFTSSNTQHGGQESTLLSFHITLLHQGMIVAGLPYSFAGQCTDQEITGCSPYGASTVAGSNGQRTPTNNELDGARFQGKYIADLALRLKK